MAAGSAAIDMTETWENEGGAVVEPVTVDRAAILAHGVVFHMPRPFRHGHLIKAMAQIGVPTPINGCSGGGFLLSDGRFADRSEAKLVAWRAAQITEARMEQQRVFCTEDLW